MSQMSATGKRTRAPSEETSSPKRPCTTSIPEGGSDDGGDEADAVFEANEEDHAYDGSESDDERSSLGESKEDSVDAHECTCCTLGTQCTGVKTFDNPLDEPGTCFVCEQNDGSFSIGFACDDCIENEDDLHILRKLSEHIQRLHHTLTAANKLPESKCLQSGVCISCHKAKLDDPTKIGLTCSECRRNIPTCFHISPAREMLIALHHALYPRPASAAKRDSSVVALTWDPQSGLASMRPIEDSALPQVRLTWRNIPPNYDVGGYSQRVSFLDMVCAHIRRDIATRLTHGMTDADVNRAYLNLATSIRALQFDANAYKAVLYFDSEDEASKLQLVLKSQDMDFRRPEEAAVACPPPTSSHRAPESPVF